MRLFCPRRARCSRGVPLSFFSRRARSPWGSWPLRCLFTPAPFSWSHRRCVHFFEDAQGEKRKSERKPVFVVIRHRRSPTTSALPLFLSLASTHRRARASPSASPGSTRPAAGAREEAQIRLIIFPLWEAETAEKAEKAATTTTTPLTPRPRSPPPTPFSLSRRRRSSSSSPGRAPLARPLLLLLPLCRRESTSSSPPTARPT